MESVETRTETLSEPIEKKAYVEWVNPRREEQIEKKMYTKWVNQHLKKVQDSVEDLFKDFCSGVKLLKLIECLTGCKLKPEEGPTRVHDLANVDKAFRYLKEEAKMKLHGISTNSIVNGQHDITLALVWNMILKFELSSFAAQLRQTSREGTPDISLIDVKRELMQWVKQTTEGYKEVHVTNFSSRWDDGMALCAVINKHRPDLLDYNECDPNQPKDNLKKASAVAEELGVEQSIDLDEADITVKFKERSTVMFLQMLRTKLEETSSTQSFQGHMASQQPSTDAIKGTQTTPDVPTGPETSRDDDDDDDDDETEVFVEHSGNDGSDSDDLSETAEGIEEPEVDEESRSATKLSDHAQTTDLEAFEADTPMTSNMSSENCDNGVDDDESDIEDPTDATAATKMSKAPVRIPTSKPVVADAESIDQKVKRLVSQCSCPHKAKLARLDKKRYQLQVGKYMKIIHIRTSTAMVSVGGGWVPLQEYLSKYDSCRKAKNPIVLEEDPKHKLAKVSLPQNSNQVNDKFSDNLMMQSHYGPSKAMGATSSPSQVTNSYPVKAHNRTSHTRITSTNGSSSRTPPPTITANKEPSVEIFHKEPSTMLIDQDLVEKGSSPPDYSPLPSTSPDFSSAASSAKPSKPSRIPIRSSSKKKHQEKQSLQKTT